MQNGSQWEAALTQIDGSIDRLKSVKKEVKRLEKAEEKYGSQVVIRRRMTIENFDDDVMLECAKIA